MKIVINFLEKKVNEYKRSKEKSINSFKRGAISQDTHNCHLTNLNILINQFSKAIRILKFINKKK